jgi:hypothetical protein
MIRQSNNIRLQVVQWQLQRSRSAYLLTHSPAIASMESSLSPLRPMNPRAGPMHALDVGAVRRGGWKSTNPPPPPPVLRPYLTPSRSQQELLMDVLLVLPGGQLHRHLRPLDQQLWHLSVSSPYHV